MATLLEAIKATPQHFFSGCFDVSHNNGQIDWSSIPDLYSLVFIKASQGSRFRDPKFVENYKGATENELLVVPYHFINQEPAAEQLKNFLSAAALHRNSVVMLDWEADTPKNMPGVHIVQELIDGIITLTNRKPLVYHGIYVLTSPKINSCPWHVPKYGPEPKLRNWLFWQDNPAKLIPGIGHVDHDFFNGTEEELNDWFYNATLPERLQNV